MKIDFKHSIASIFSKSVLILRNNKSLFLVMAISLVVSLAYSFYFHLKPVVDAKGYDSIAWNIVQGYGYVSDPSLPLEQDYAIFRVGPGYELFLSAVYFVFGHRYWLVWIIHALLLSASAGLAFLLSLSKISSSNVGI